MVGRRTPPELVLYGGAVWGTAVKVIVRERRSVTGLGVAAAFAFLSVVVRLVGRVVVPRHLIVAGHCGLVG
ncbi:MAG: hypothetical protein U5O16_21710 [Rhodococcus sp. (in: high G+C Gram-positive bacteria)]|uniref:hypothetical protein n=1 Tax=Rhodococcus sp. TaxID=1831 RepID=UPI002ADC69D1|nr:hypothetical protein [Rhodococcus sp. (in: high G+C Gram-positive bacteria)]